MNKQEIQPYWNKQIEFFSTIFITWKHIADVFQIHEMWELSDPDEPPTTDIINAALREASQIIDVSSDNLDENTLLDAENKLIKSISKHWSADSVLPKHLNIEELINNINIWSSKGATNKNLFPIEPPAGNSIEYVLNKTGINITIYPPFIIPYTELYYSTYDDLPEWNLIDLTSDDIVETLYLAYLYLFGNIEIDLSSWDEERENIFNT